MEISESIVADIRELRSDVDGLYKTVYQGNGTPSLTNQVTQLNERLDALEERIINNIETIDTEMSLKFDNITSVVNEKFNHISYQIAHEFERTKLKEAGSHQLKANLVSASIATITAIIAIFLNHIIELTHTAPH
jgi:coproporphyrinogen III oxidase-like Fe-S oxidoreductase